MRSLRLVSLLICAATISYNYSYAAAPEPINGTTLKPGLNAVYRSIAGESTLYRIDSTPAFAFGNSSPHPRIEAGPFSVVWTGVIQLRGDGPYSFDAYLGGELAIHIDDAVVLKGRGESESANIHSDTPLQRPAGRCRIKIEYHSLLGVPARLQIWWKGADFRREPLPSWLLTHSTEESPDVALQENAAAAGRIAAGRFGCALCHRNAFPAIHDPPPGPSLAGIGTRVSREWLFTFLNDPGKACSSPRMPKLFKSNRDGSIERWIIAEYLCKESTQGVRADAQAGGDHRHGRHVFLSIGCVACHFVPELKREEQKDLDRIAY